MRGSREISLVSSLHRASTDALIWAGAGKHGTTSKALPLLGITKKKESGT